MSPPLVCSHADQNERNPHAERTRVLSSWRTACGSVSPLRSGRSDLRVGDVRLGAVVEHRVDVRVLVVVRVVDILVGR